MLIVDDAPINRQVLALILDTAGIVSEEACDGREGVALCETEQFDAVLMDLQMPVMDGFEAIRRIREGEARRNGARLPIYIVSANGFPEDVAAGAAAGADGHLHKPISVPGLLSALAPHRPSPAFGPSATAT